MTDKTIHIEERKRWHLSQVDKKKVTELSEKLSISHLLAKILLARNVGDGDISKISDFISPPEELLANTQNISSPEDIQKALTRIQKAVATRESILVNGDPDADGITGTAILVAGLRQLGCNVEYDFPIRPLEGHGLQPRIIDKAKEQNISLIITVDCGTKDVVACDYSNSLGIDIIVCDHHILGKKIPSAHAIINPYRCSSSDAAYNLAGASVAFKVILALYNHLGQEMPESLFNFLLALAALGTISDRASLKNSMNRIIVKKGIQSINETKKAGLKALRTVSSSSTHTKIPPRDISRTIVPRINAPGRIGNPFEDIPDSNLVVDLLLLGTGKKNKKKAEQMIQKFSYLMDLQQEMRQRTPAIEEAELVNNINEKRQMITSKIEDEIEKLISLQVDLEKDRIIIIKGQNWNLGVIGIDTDRLKDRFIRPAMILTQKDDSDYIRGSVRSIPTINMYKIIEDVADSFEQKFNRPLFKVEVTSQLGNRTINAFGGHSQACGFTLHKNDLNVFIKNLHAEMAKLEEDQFNFSHEILATINFSDLTLDFLKELNSLSPYGQEFEFPLFLMKNCILSNPRPFGNKYQTAATPHVEFRVSTPPADNRQYSSIVAVGFSLWDKYGRLVSNEPGKTYDIIFSFDVLTRKKKKSFNKLQLFVHDIRLS